MFWTLQKDFLQLQEPKKIYTNMNVSFIDFTFIVQFESSFLEPSLSDLLSQGEHFTEKLRIQTGNGHFSFLSEQLHNRKLFQVLAP